MHVVNRTLSHNAETKDFAHLTSHPVQGWTGKKQSFLFSWDSKLPPCDKGLLINKLKHEYQCTGHFSESLGLLAIVHLLIPPSQPIDFFATPPNSGMTRLGLIVSQKRMVLGKH